jgi:mRNA-degrading endonuclease RelE of RelBE toxin-antitoxin system
MTTFTPWEIVLAGPARKSLERVPSPDRERIEAALRQMTANPFQGDLKLLKGQQKTFRRRIGAWRIFFFRVADEKRIVVSAIERRTSTTY